MSAEHGAGRRVRPAGVSGVVGKPPDEVAPADVLGFITAQRTGRRYAAMVQPVDAAQEPTGVATSTVARRLSIISGFFTYLQARGDITANPVPRGLPTRRERSRPGHGAADPQDPPAATDSHPGRGRPGSSPASRKAKHHDQAVHG